MGAPLAALAVLAAVSGGFAPAAFEGAGVWTGRVGTEFGHAWIQGWFLDQGCGDGNLGQGFSEAVALGQTLLLVLIELTDSDRVLKSNQSGI